MLGTLTHEQKRKWKVYLPGLIYAYNCTPHTTTGFSPFYLVFGRHPRLPIDHIFQPEITSPKKSVSYADELKDRLQVAHELAGKHQKLAADKNQLNYDKTIHGLSLSVGDECLVKKRNEAGVKLGDRWEEEVYVVQEQPNADIPVFVVKRKDGKGRHKTLHRNNLLPLPVPIREDDTASLAPLPQRTPRPRVRRQHKTKAESIVPDVESSDEETTLLVRKHSVRRGDTAGEPDDEGTQIRTKILRGC
jgi:hypothetical protein